MNVGMAGVRSLQARGRRRVGEVLRLVRQVWRVDLPELYSELVAQGYGRALFVSSMRGLTCNWA